MPSGGGENPTITVEPLDPRLIPASGDAASSRADGRSSLAAARYRELELLRHRDGKRRFAALGEVARDGRRSVVHAYDDSLRREVRLWRWDVTDLSPERRETIITRARAMAAVSHRNVVDVYGVYADDDEIVLATEPVRGQTLWDWQQERRLSWRELLAVYRQAGLGLAAGHRCGVVHGQFDPRRAFITVDGTVKVDELGLQHHEAAEGLTSEEILMRGVAADQQALCQALWEALVGHPPLVGGGPPIWPKHVAAPSFLEAALTHGLTPGEGFESLEALLAALDPPRSRPMAIVAGGSATVVLGTLLWTWQADRSERCGGAPQHLHDAWAGRREAVRDAMLATGTGFAQQTWERVEQHLDQYEKDWTEHHRTACESTTVRHEQAPEVMDLRMSCLQRGKAALTAAVDLLQGAEPDVVEQAVTIVTQLPRVAFCSDVEALQSAVPPPQDPTVASEVRQAREDLARVQVLIHAAKYEDARERLSIIEQRLGDIDYAPVQLELELLEGEALAASGRYDEALPVLQRGLALALGGSAYETVAHALWKLTDAMQHVRTEAETQRLARVMEDIADSCDCVELQARARAIRSTVALAMGDKTGAEQLARDASSLLKHELDAPHLATAYAAVTLGNALWALERHEEALVEHRRAVNIRETALGPEHPEVAWALTNVGAVLNGAGRHAEAERELKRALMLIETALGPNHPRSASIRNNLAFALWSQSRPAEAMEQFQRALAAGEPVFGSDHINVAVLLNNIGLTQIEQGLYRDSEVALQRSAEIFERHEGPEHPDVVITRGNIGAVQLMQGKYAEAEVQLRAVLGFTSKTTPVSLDLERRWRLNLARALSHQQKHADAREVLEDAWKTIDPNDDAEPLRAQVAFALAEALWHWRSERRRAVRLARRASAALSAMGPEGEVARREVEAWLKTRIDQSAE